jgi:hypothetical protein
MPPMLATSSAALMVLTVQRYVFIFIPPNKLRLFKCLGIIAVDTM